MIDSAIPAASAGAPGAEALAGARRSRVIEDLERELKFVVPATRADLVLRWIRTVARPDPQFPDADVSTVYYDTPTFGSLDEKLNSDYLKMKIRLRWYAPPGGAAAGPAFVEAKLRVGDRREKVRVRLPVPASALSGRPLADPLFRELPRLLAPEGVIVGPAWTPMLALRYRRRRFVEATSGARLNVDSEITAVGVHHRFLVTAHPGPLPLSVVEVKGMGDDLPPRLRPLIALGARRETFSKYAALLLHAQRRVV